MLSYYYFRMSLCFENKQVVAHILFIELLEINQ